MLRLFMADQGKQILKRSAIPELFLWMVMKEVWVHSPQKRLEVLLNVGLPQIPCRCLGDVSVHEFSLILFKATVCRSDSGVQGSKANG